MKAMSELDWQSLVRDTDRGAAGGKERLWLLDAAGTVRRLGVAVP